METRIYYVQLRDIWLYRFGFIMRRRAKYLLENFTLSTAHYILKQLSFLFSTAKHHCSYSLSRICNWPFSEFKVFGHQIYSLKMQDSHHCSNLSLAVVTSRLISTTFQSPKQWNVNSVNVKKRNSQHCESTVCIFRLAKGIPCAFSSHW